MGKVQVIQKSRKEYKCSRCGKVIPVGSRYYKGEINFGPTIIRCNNCKLEPWEVTTSDYQLSVGNIVYRWQKDYGDELEYAPENIAGELEIIRDEVQERLDNMPEGLQEGDVGQTLQERIDYLDSTIDDLYSISIEDLKQQAVDDVLESDIDLSYDEELEKLTTSDVLKANELVEAFHDLVSDAINEALNNIEI